MARLLEQLASLRKISESACRHDIQASLPDVVGGDRVVSRSLCMLAYVASSTTAKHRITQVHQAYRFALEPTASQVRALASHCGAARFAFNWGLEQVQAAMALREFELCMFGEVRSELLGWSLPALRREWNCNKAVVAPWWVANSKESYSSGLAWLAAGLKNWYVGRRGAPVGEPVGFPRFRRRGQRDSCAFTTGVIRVDDARHVTLPRIGRMRTSESTTKLLEGVALGTCRILRATVSREADRWFVSFTCVVERRVFADSARDEIVGVDLGVHKLAALSTGELVAGARPLRRAQRRLRRLQRTVSRRRKGSARRRRAVGRMARAHRRVANVRRHHLHVLTTRLAQNHGYLVIEDLNVRGMSRSARGTQARPGRHVRAKAGLNRAVVDSGFGPLRRMLEYKCTWYGSRLLVCDRWFPSSKRCSTCGAVRERLSRLERTFRCDSCGLRLDRDVNAARNLVWWAEAHPGTASAAGTGSASTPDARGVGERSGTSGDGDVEAGTGTDPEPSSTTGGRRRQERPLVRP